MVFLSEDGFEVARYGDRTLSKYRQLVIDNTGAACPNPQQVVGQRPGGKHALGQQRPPNFRNRIASGLGRRSARIDKTARTMASTRLPWTETTAP